MDYYVSNDGNDTNPGTIELPWKTITKVNSEFGNVISPGDNIYFKRGDTFNDAQLTIGVSGENVNNQTVIGAYDIGDKPKLNRVGGHGIYMATKHDIIIDNLSVENAGRLIRLSNGCVRITIQNCDLIHSPGDWGSIYIHPDGGAGHSYIYILNNHIEDGHGDLITMHATTYGLIEGNTIIGGLSNDHSCLIVRSESKYVVVRKNIIYDGFDDNSQCVGYTESCLFEDNIIFDDNPLTPGAGFKMQTGYRHIVRNNIIYGTGSYGLGGYTNAVSKSVGVSYNKWYNNTIYNIGTGDSMHAAWRIVVYADAIFGIHHNVIKNNIIHTSNRYGLYASFTPEQGALLHDNLFDNNIVYNSIRADVLYRRLEYTLAQAENNFPENFQNNIDIAPLLVDPTNGDFSLQPNSPAIQAASPLTTTNGAGNGTQITLDDAGYFCDGFGLINGDQTTIASNPPVTITNVNYDTNIITVDQIVSWNDGDPVYLAGCYDIGAVQSGVEPNNCINPLGQQGAIICGNPDYGQDPTHQYQCTDGVWTDLGYSSDCAVPPPPPEIPVWVWPLLLGSIVLSIIIVKRR